MASQLYRRRPPLRAAPDQPDEQDGARIEYLRSKWHSQDDALRLRDRHIEENIRMLCGQQWNVWSPLLQRYVDVNDWMTDQERRWRQRPVVNRMMMWYMLTHARLTENPPIITWQPATADRFDAMLAEVMDPLWKMTWSKAGMLDVNDDVMQWLIPGGQAFACSRIDPAGGMMIPRIGPAMLPLETPMGTQEVYAEQVPYDEQGNPLAKAFIDELGEPTYDLTGDPFYEHEGSIEVDVYSPLQCRGEWGNMPWHRRKWHMIYTFMTCERIFEEWGVEVDPERGEQVSSSMELQRLLFGSGFYGSAGGAAGSDGVLVNMKEGFSGVYTAWEAPCDFEGMEQTQESPGGRLMIGTRSKMLYDGPRPADFPYGSPIRRFQFIKIPGRPGGSTPQEAMNPVARTMNRGTAQILEHRNLSCNPIGIIDQMSGIKDKDITNRPGTNLRAVRRPNVPVFEYVAPPRLSEDVWRTQAQLKEDWTDLASIEGASGRVPTRDASGELVKELRSNSDRPFGPTARRNVEEYARMGEDWKALYKLIYPMERVITLVGEDAAPMTVVVYPEMFENGRVNAIPDIESMLPEGRGERQAKIYQLWKDGAWGQPGIDPQANRIYLQLARFPHLGRASRIGGVDEECAKREISRLVMGDQNYAMINFPWYDQMIHLAVIEEHMKSPEWLLYDQNVQQLFQIHWQMHKDEVIKIQMAQQAEMDRQAKLQGQNKQQPPQAA